MLPGFRPHVNAGEGAGLSHQVGKFHPTKRNQPGDNASAGGQEQDDHAAHDHGGDEVGQIGGNLEKLFVFLGGDLVAQKGHHNGEGERHQNGVQTDDQSVFDGWPELVGIEILLKVFHAGPRALKDSLRGGEIFKSDDNAKHWLVGKTEHQNDSGQEEQV